MSLMAAPVVPIFEVGDYDAPISKAVELLREGGVVVLPTETVYGAAAVLGHHKAMARLKAIRDGANGPDATAAPADAPAADATAAASPDDATAAKPFTIHLDRRERALRYVGDVSDTGRRLMQKLWPGPV